MTFSSKHNTQAHKAKYYAYALFVVFSWGVSFVNTKVLLDYGLTPNVIYLYRFTLAYLLLLIISNFKVSILPLKDEITAACCGLFGGTIYFIAENTALKLTLVSNVAFVVNTAPLLTALLIFTFHKEEKLSRNMIIGSLTALCGSSLIIFQKGFSLGNGVLGSILALTAALSWAIYSLLLKKIENKYQVTELTRKIFFYGIISSFIFTAINNDFYNIQLLAQPVVLGNLLFLGIVCSLMGFYLWNVTVKALGAVKTSNFLYISPIISIIMSIIILNERASAIGLIGCALTLTGVIIADKKQKCPRQ